jgi:hypothetical protein
MQTLNKHFKKRLRFNAQTCLFAFFFSFFFVLPNRFLSAQNTCGCDHIINETGFFFQSATPNRFNRNVLPGQTVCIMAGNYKQLVFNNFRGTAAQPIKFKNCGGLVTIGTTRNIHALEFRNCRYFRVTGTGDPSVNYGIRVDSSGGQTAMAVGYLSSDVEIDHLEIAGAGFAGIMAKTDPNCNPNTWRGNFTMENVNIHDNYIHDVKGEGFYVGNTFFSQGMNVNCSGQIMTVFPHNIVNLKIHHNIVRRCGAECLQYGCAPNAQIHDNDLENCGFSPFAAFQINGIQCSGSGGDCYNNKVRNVAGSGLAIIGHLGNNRFYNNLLINMGGDAIFCDDRVGSLPNTYCDFINNTIINSGRDAMRLYNQNNSILIANNVMVGMAQKFNTGNCIVFLQGATATQLNNYCSRPYQLAGLFADTINFDLAANSPLINTGTDVSSYGVTSDFSGRLRPLGGAYDRGAQEYASAAPPPLLSMTNSSTRSMKIYPSVTTGILTVENAGEVEVVNTVGQVVLVAKNLKDFGGLLNLRHLPNGIYLVRGSNTEGGIFSEKIVKQ